MNSERDSIYLAHILECIERIQDYTGNNRKTFMNSSERARCCITPKPLFNA